MKVLQVYFHGFAEPCLLGQLSYEGGVSYFEYDADFLGRGIELSPLQLPAELGLQQGPRDPFQGLHGLFADSLPDGWGLYLQDKYWRERGLSPSELTSVDRLALTGIRTMGALSYAPDEGAARAMFSALKLDEIAREAVAVYSGEASAVLEALVIHGSPSGGARPKLLVGLCADELVTGAADIPTGFTHWLAKFPIGSTPDKKAEGAVEYVFSLMAKLADIAMTECQLVQGPEGNAYFLTRRFDRRDDHQRVHVHSVAGLMHTDFRVADFDYLELMKLCALLTRSHAEKLELVRRLVFNVMSGNRDDHSKNFSFIWQSGNEWVNAPAYDLTFSAGLGGEHSMAVCGKGRDITSADILAVALQGSISAAQTRSVIEQIAQALGEWASLAQEYGVPTELRTEIGTYIERQRKRLAGG